jgi:glycosyltransferase involved in cell wall biosynthesis
MNDPVRPSWEAEAGLRGRLYALGRRVLPLGWRRALRRRLAPEQLLGIRKPAVELTTLPGPAAGRAGSRPDLILLPVIPWSYRRQRPQQLAEALARRGHRVFYGSLAGSGEPAEPVDVATGVTLLPIAGVRREDPWDRRLGEESLVAAADSLARARERFEIREGVLLVESPFWEPLCADLRRRFGWRVVYDCLDAHEAFATNRAKSLVESEKRLAASADLVLATSEPLRARLDASGARSYLLPNASDFRFFAFDSEFEGPPVRSRSPKGPVVVGYVGAVGEWFDAELFNRLVAFSPDWRFEVVGGADGGRAGILPAPNLILHGERPYAELKPFLSRVDVEIVPFKLTALTHATDPVKVYEAAAAGLPVVATPMEALRGMARLGIVRFASTPEDFRREIASALAEGPDAAAARRAFAADNTWDDRAAALDGWLEPLLAAAREPRDAGNDPEQAVSGATRSAP